MKHPAVIIVNGDLRLSANQATWEAQAQVEQAVSNALIGRGATLWIRSKAPVVVRAVLAAIAVAVLALPVCAQLYDGSLTGVVTDPSGAVIAGAQVTLTDIGKQYKHTTVSDAQGRYLLRSLPPSSYRLSVEAAGFQTYSQDRIKVDVKENVTVDAHLNLGTAASTVQVTATAPQLDAQDATTGQEVNQVYISNLPSLSRELMDYTYLTPGVNPGAGNSYGSFSWTEYGTNWFTSNGSRAATTDVLVDGVSSTGYSGTPGIQLQIYHPSPDAVQEFKVEQNNFSAEIGYTGSTVINEVTKSGTNKLHGSVYEFDRNSALDGNNWFNPNKTPTPGIRYNDFGATVGGPIIKNKTFFFADYEGNRIRSDTGEITAGVPSQAERNGDFGELCGYQGGTFNSAGLCSASSGAGQIWDPYSGVYNSNDGGADRSAFIPFNNLATYTSPGNPNLPAGYQLPAVPGNLIDPVAKKMMSYYPLPNNFTSGPNGSYNPGNNWASSGVSMFDHDQIDVRVDQQFSQKNTMNARFSWGRNPSLQHQAFNNALDTRSVGPSGYNPRMFALNDSHIFNTKTVLNISYGFSRVLHHVAGVPSLYPGFDPVTTLGFPAYIDTSGYKAAPTVYLNDGYVDVDGYTGSIGSQLYNSYQRFAQETHHLTGAVSHVRGPHELKFGAEMRLHRVNQKQPGTPNGAFCFDHFGTNKNPNDSSGDAMASFLTGFESSSQGCSWYGGYEIPNAPATHNYADAFYALDNWKVTSTLTVNLGLRYELEIPRIERHNDMEWFNPNVAAPLSSAAVVANCQADQSQSGLSVLQLPCANLANLHGGEVYASNSERHVLDINYHLFAPRIGVAWRVRSSTVIRTGYGIFYQPTELGAAGIGADGFLGYDQFTYWQTSYNNDGATPWGRLSNPFPNPTGGPGNGLILPTGNSLGLATNLGNVADGPIRTWTTLPYTQTWSFGIQHQLPYGVLVDVNYVGTKGTHLYFGATAVLTHLGEWVKSASGQEIADLLTYVPNPFYTSNYSIIPFPSAPLANSSYIPLWQLYMPYPQYQGVGTQDPTFGGSTYNALQVRVEKRMSNGLQLLATYVNSKNMDNVSSGTGGTWISESYVQNGMIDPNDPSRERSIAQTDIPQVLTLAWVYELPVGKGKSWGGGWNSWENGFLGGWKFSGTWRFDDGTPLSISEQNSIALPGGYSTRPNLLAPLKRNHGSNWMNQYFANPSVVVGSAPFTLGNAPRFLSSVRAPGTNNPSMALSKDFGLGALHEGTSMQFRIEAFNVFNHPQFSGPNTTINTIPYTFGQVTSVANSPRDVQLGLRVSF